MTLNLKILRRAREDAQHIYEHIQLRSPQGATNWWIAFSEAVRSAQTQLIEYELAPENDSVSYRLQQVLFEKRKGRMYRFVFTIVGDELRILRVRGPRQPKLSPDELSGADRA